MKKLFFFVPGTERLGISLIKTTKQLKPGSHASETKCASTAIRNGTGLLIFLTMLFLVSCKKDDPVPVSESGTLIVDIGLFIHVEEVNSRLKSALAVEDFKVTIYRSDGTEAMIFETVSSMPDTVKLEPGEYYVEAHSDNNLPAAFENPYYYGISEVFSISSNTQQSVQVICKLANTIVSVVYSDNIKSSFNDYSATVSTELGSLVFLSDEIRRGYFQTSALDILVELSYLNPDGTQSSKTLSGSIPDPLANKHYQINVDASLDQAMASFQILMDSEEVTVEMVELSEDPIIPEGATAYGDLLITEIMFDPLALSDTEGEWFEIYNNSDHSIDLQNMILQRNATDTHIIEGSIELLAGEYYVMARTATATEALNSYVYGTDISLTNSGSVLAIYNEGTEAEPGALIFSVDYGAADFPSAAGASISLSPSIANPGNAVQGIFWCLSSSVYSTGDAGTPGTVNDPCD